jgi:hypothetical protein
LGIELTDGRKIVSAGDAGHRGDEQGEKRDDSGN